MSATASRPNRQPVIAAVLVLVAVAVVINAVVMRPGRKRPRAATVRVQAAPPVPDDLLRIANASPPSADLGVYRATDAPRLRRDPFGTPAPRRRIVGEQDPEAPAAPAPAPLICDAILTGARGRSAVVSGRLCREGDTVREHEVIAVESTGVTLRAGDGSTLVLPVRAARGTGRSVVVTGARGGSATGGTNLVEHARGERK